MTTFTTVALQSSSSLILINPTAINDSGEVVGVAPVIGAPNEQNGFLFVSGTASLLNDGAGNSYSIAESINNNGEIAGAVEVGVLTPYQAVVWNNGTPTILKTLVAGEFSNALSINDKGDVAGIVNDGTGPNAVVWLNGQGPTALSNAPGSTQAGALGINNAGQIVGYAEPTSSGGTGTYAVLWNSVNSAPVDLGIPAGYASAQATGINASGLIFGEAYANGVTASFTWKNGTFTILPLLSGYTSSVPLGMNAEGQIVGYETSGSTGHAVLWQNGQVVDINTFTGKGPPGTIFYMANGINDYGQIVTTASGGPGLLFSPSTLPATLAVPTLTANSADAVLVDLPYAPFNPSATTLTLNGTTLSVVEGTANLGSSTLSNATGLTSANFYVVEDANGGTEIHVSSSAAAVASFTITDTTLGTTTTSPGVAYSGPVTGLQYQYISTGSDSVNVTANIADVFLHGGTGGNNALAALSGQNVLDGGQGSNFLVGVAATTAAPTGQDTFFVDGRGTAAVWSTVVNFHQGDAATIWGVTSTTAIETVANAGATGYQGFTLHADTLGNGSYSSSITLAGVSQAHVSETFGTVGGTPYLYLTYV